MAYDGLDGAWMVAVDGDEVGGVDGMCGVKRIGTVSSEAMNVSVSPTAAPASSLSLSLPAAWRALHRLFENPVVGKPTQHRRVGGRRRGGGKLTQTPS